MLRLEQTTTGVISKTLEVRLKAQAVNSNVTGNIIHEVGGSIKTVALSGTVKTALPFTDMSTEECNHVGPLRGKDAAVKCLSNCYHRSVYSTV